MRIPKLKKRFFAISLMFAQAAFAGSDTSSVDEENFEVSELLSNAKTKQY